jgi:hypothetical protein
MPVKRFRSLADAERALWLEPGSPEIWEAARRRWALHRALQRSPPDHQRGVFKYRSITDKQRATAG